MNTFRAKYAAQDPVMTGFGSPVVATITPVASMGLNILAIIFVPLRSFSRSPDFTRLCTGGPPSGGDNGCGHEPLRHSRSKADVVNELSCREEGAVVDLPGMVECWGHRPEVSGPVRHQSGTLRAPLPERKNAAAVRTGVGSTSASCWMVANSAMYPSKTEACTYGRCRSRRCLGERCRGPAVGRCGSNGWCGTT